MREDTELPFRLPDLPDSVGPIQPFPRSVVWSAGVLIALLGAFGLFQGFHSAISHGSGRGGDEEEGGSGAVSAQAAVPMPANAQWSTLSGPAMTPPAPKPAASAAPSNEDDESAAVESEAPGAVPAAAAAAVNATPQAQSAAPSATSSAPAAAPSNPDQEKDQF